MGETKSGMAILPMSDHRQNARATDACVTARWPLLLVGALLVLASWWSSATTCLRVLVLWVIALGVFGQWGQRRLSDSSRAILAALIGAGMVHLVVLPASGQPLTVLTVKAIIFLAALASLPRQVSGEECAAKPFAKWNRYVAAGVAVSAAMGVLYVCAIVPARNAPTATFAILAPLAYVLIFGSVACHYQRPKQRQYLVRLLLAVPVTIAALSATQFLLLGITKQRAERAFQRDELNWALHWNTVSLAINERLRIRVADDRLLLQRMLIYDALDQPANALDTLIRRCRFRYPPPDDTMLRALSEAYLATSPLDAQIVALSHPAYLWRWDNLPLPENLRERSVFLGLFVRRGLLDRLLIEYAQHGLSDGLDFGYLLGSIKPQSFADPNSETWAHYLSGVCQARLGRRDAACDHFRRVLSRWSGYHNAQVWLERLGATGESQLSTKTTSSPVGRIANTQMLGNHKWGLNVDDALWTALEVRPGRYALHFEVNGLPAEGEWPILTVHLDGALVLEQPVRTQTWTTATWETQFDRDACHRLVVGFSNDILKTVGGREINRNLYLRQIRITKIGRDKTAAD
jgi:hypothetical protein